MREGLQGVEERKKEEDYLAWRVCHCCYWSADMEEEEKSYGGVAIWGRWRGWVGKGGAQ
jgi:hypothetical protein